MSEGAIVSLYCGDLIEEDLMCDIDVTHLREEAGHDCRN